jgi:hypothetical protein
MNYLQKGPDGLLGALDLKTTGANPSQFPEHLQAVVECTPYYLLRNRFLASATAAFAAINVTIASLTVPQDEVWRVKALGITLSRVVGDAALVIDATLNLRRAIGAANVVVFQALFPAVPATDLIQARGQIVEDFWLGPGDRVAVASSSTVNVGDNFTVQLDYDRMPSG